MERERRSGGQKVNSVAKLSTLLLLVLYAQNKLWKTCKEATSRSSNIPKDCKSGNYEGFKKVQPNYMLLACLVKKKVEWVVACQRMNEFPFIFCLSFQKRRRINFRRAWSQNFQICTNDSSLCANLFQMYKKMVINEGFHLQFFLW